MPRYGVGVALGIGVGFAEEGGDGGGAAVGVEGHIEAEALGDLARLGGGKGLGADDDPGFHRGSSHMGDFGHQFQALANPDRGQKRHAVDRRRRDSRPAVVAKRGQRAAFVKQTKDHPAVDYPERICLRRVRENRQGNPRGRREFGRQVGFGHVSTLSRNGTRFETTVMLAGRLRAR